MAHVRLNVKEVALGLGLMPFIILNVRRVQKDYMPPLTLRKGALRVHQERLMKMMVPRRACLAPPGHTKPNGKRPRAPTAQPAHTRQQLAR